MKFSFDHSVKEFIAKIICDLGKAILTVGFASYFFEKLPFPLRVAFVFIGVIITVIGIILYALKGDNK